MRVFLLVLTIFISAGLAGCNRPSSAGDPQPGQASAAGDSNRAGAETSSAPQTDAPDAARADSQQTAPAQPPQQPAQEEKRFRSPSFLDANTGQIKDLPSYPNASRTNIQIGPIKGIETTLILLQTFDPFEKVTAYYNRVFPEKGWKIVRRIDDGATYHVELEKGDKHEGLVEVKRNSSTEGLVEILLNRIEKPAAQAQ